MPRRVAIIADAREHLGPDLARKLAFRDHDLVLGAPADGLVDELRSIGARVEVSEAFRGPEDLAQEGTVQSLVDLALDGFGGFEAAFIRPAVHITGDILSATADDMRRAFEGNMFSAFLALQALLPALIEQGKGGQVLIGSSGAGVKPSTGVTAYSAAKAGAIMLVRNASLTVASHGISVNAIGTMALNYPGFLQASGGTDPKVLDKIVSGMPQRRLGEPDEVAHIAAALLDGQSNFMTGEFVSLSGGWTSQ
jgi:NAD(P)-dependent dehydrogenase (short-subunit alcohol dehydrogenase family)